MNIKSFLLTLTLLIVSVTLFAFNGVLKDFTDNDGDSDIDTPYIYYFDDIYTNFGGQWQQPINAHKGKQYFLQTQTPPTDVGYIAEFHPNIAKKDAGEFCLMASMIPMGVPYGSPVQIYVDGEQVRDYISNNVPVPTGKKAYGVSSALKWCDFGKINLTAGEHTISFVVRTDTALTKGMYVQGYDCFALVKYAPMPDPKWKDAPVPLFYKNIAPQEKPIFSYWTEAEDSTNHNLSVFTTEQAYNGKHLFFEGQRTDNFAEFEVNVDKAGKYLIMGATGPVGQVFISPVDLYVDDYLVGSFTSRPATEIGWGYSGILRWVSYGMVDLTADTHTFKFTFYKNRNMDKLIIQGFDALALVDADLLDFKVSVTPDNQEKIIAKPKDKLNISLKPILTKASITSATEVPLTISLMKDGYKVKDNLAKVKIDPNAINEPLEINFETEVPFDVSEGDYYLQCDNILTPNKAHLLDLTFTGKYNPPAQKSLVAENLSVTGGTIKAGEPFSFKMTADLKAPAESEILTIIFEKEKDVAYYAVSVPVPGLKGATGPFSADLTFTLPEGMPKGKVSGLLSLDKDISSSAPVSFDIDSKYTEATTSLKPLSYGFFKDSTGMTQVWYSNAAHSLYWNGKPWMKVSAMFNGPYMSFSSTEDDFEGFKENVQRLKARGLYHIYLFTQGPMSSINVEKWGTIMDYLEQEGFTYVIGFPNGAAPTTPLRMKQVRANPDKAKIEKNVTGLHKRTIKGAEYDMGGREITSVQCAALDPQGNVIEVKDAKITFVGADFVETEVDFGQNPVDIVYTTEYYSAITTDNPWADFNAQTQETGRFIKTANLRPGFRGFVDLIMSNERGLYNCVEPIFINSPEFLKEREKQLTEKYKNINALKKAWFVKGDFVKTIGEAAALYPVYNNGETVFLTCDVNKGKRPIYKIDAQSPYWYEYLDMRDISYGDYEDRMIDKIKEVCDAPVNIKLCGMPEFYDYARKANRHGIDGVGCETYATGEGHITYNVGYRYVEMETSKKNMIGYSTEMGRGWADDMYPNWPDIHALFYDLGVTHYLGSRITYLFLYDVLPQTLYERNRIARDPRIMEWMNLWQEILDDKTEYIANYKPEIYTSWPRPDAWWPSCSERRALRETDDAYGVNQVKCANGVWAVPTCEPFTKSKLTFVTLNDNPGVDYYKADFEKLLKLNDREIVMLGHRKNLGALSVDKYYTNRFIEDDSYEYQELKVPQGAEVLQEKDGVVWAMKIGKLQIIAAYPKKKFNALEDLAKFARLPEVDPERADASGFLEKGLGMTFATFGNNSFKAIGYTLKGEDVCVLHTTQKPGNVNVGFTAKKDCTFTVPYMNFEKKLAAGESLIVTLPESDINNQSQGAGMGYIKIIGEKLEDLQFNNITMDTLPKASKSGYEVSGLPAGMKLPKPTRPEQFSVNTIEMMKAKAGFDTAVDEYNYGSYANAQQYLEEYLPLAGAELAVPFNVFLGNVSIMRGKTEDAVKYYSIALEKAPGLGDAMTGLGCALYNTDKDKAIELWKGANTEEAKHNLEVAGK